MDEKVIELLKWVVGIFLTMLGAMGTYIYFLHRERAKEMRDNREERKETNRTVEKTGTILEGLKTLLEHQNKR